MYKLIALSVPLIALLSSSANSAMPPLSSYGGVYSHLTWIEEAGDLLGTEVEFRPGPSPVIVVTTCEGGCSGGRAWPVTIHENRISFTVCDGGVVDQDNHPVPCDPLHYTGVFRSNGTLVLTIAGMDEGREVLRKVQHPKPHQVEQLGCNANYCK